MCGNVWKLNNLISGYFARCENDASVKTERKNIRYKVNNTFLTISFTRRKCNLNKIKIFRDVEILEMFKINFPRILRSYTQQ